MPTWAVQADMWRRRAPEKRHGIFIGVRAALVDVGNRRATREALMPGGLGVDKVDNRMEVHRG